MSGYGPDTGEFYLLAAGVPEDRMEECLKWALGDDYKKLGVGEIPKRWNKLHSSIFVMNPKDDPMWKGIVSMGMAWVEVVKPNRPEGFIEGGY